MLHSFSPTLNELETFIPWNVDIFFRFPFLLIFVLKDLLAANVRIFKSQGKDLAEFAKPTTKVQ